jgi:hypothetical protein
MMGRRSIEDEVGEVVVSWNYVSNQRHSRSRSLEHLRLQLVIGASLLPLVLTLKRKEQLKG